MDGVAGVSLFSCKMKKKYCDLLTASPSIVDLFSSGKETFVPVTNIARLLFVVVISEGEG